MVDDDEAGNRLLLLRIFVRQSGKLVSLKDSSRYFGSRLHESKFEAGFEIKQILHGSKNLDEIFCSLGLL